MRLYFDILMSLEIVGAYTIGILMNLRVVRTHEHYSNDIKFVRSRQPGIISLMSYSLLWFVKINTELLRGVFTTQRFDTPV